MPQRILNVGCLAALALALTACEMSKSSNPLSPSIAGPIEGVAISAPKLMQPDTGAQVAVDQQPLTLTVGNATSNGVRPVTYRFEISATPDFATVAYMRTSVEPGDSGKTSFQLPDPLATGRRYYWRVRAEDGANTGPYSAAGNFDVYTPIVIGAPVPIAPVNGLLVDSVRPRFTVTNAQTSGPVGPLTYVVEVSDSQAFANKLAALGTGEQPGQSVVDATADLPYSKQLYWRVRAADATVTGPWSATQLFQTPSAPVVSPPPSGGGGGGPAPNDAINLNQVAVYNSPADIASWPATVTINRLTMQPTGAPAEGLSFGFTSNWPDFTPPGWSGSIQYTVWAVVNVNGQWHTSGFIEMWRDRVSTGAPMLTDFARNWAYDARWGPMMGHQPQVGEQMGFFISAGDARGFSGVTSVRERSNVVVVSLPPGDSGTF
jgi:hypothetical protein